MSANDGDQTNRNQQAPQARAAVPLHALVALTGLIRHGLSQPLLGLRLAEAIASRQAADRSASTAAPAPALSAAVASLAAVNASLETFGAIIRAAVDAAFNPFNPTAFQRHQTMRLTEKLDTAPDVRWWFDARLSGVALPLGLLHEIANELLTNAARACGDNRVIFGMHPTGDGAGVRIRVAHSGTALPDVVQDWLAAPPDNLTAAPVHGIGHLGLGLTAIRLALAVHGGELTARAGERGALVTAVVTCGTRADPRP